MREALRSNPLITHELALRRPKIAERFDWILDQAKEGSWTTMLYPFAVQRPLSFSDEGKIREVQALLSERVEDLFTILEQSDRQLTHAISSILTASPSWANDRSVSLGTGATKEYADFEQLWHPEYSRYCEHCLNHLVDLLVAIIGLQKGRDYRSQTLANRIGVLRAEGFGTLCLGYDSTVRNAVAHGNIEFCDNGIKYIDKRATIELAPFQFLELFDELVAACNSVIVGLIAVLLSHWDQLEQQLFKPLPLGLRMLAVQNERCHRHFAPQRLIRSTRAESTQVLAMVRATLHDRDWLRWECLRMATDLWDLGGRDYERLGISIHCEKPVSPSFFINNVRLGEFLAGANSFDGVIENDLLWYPNRTSLRLIGMRLYATIAKDTFSQTIQRAKAEAGSVAPLYEIRDVVEKSSHVDRRIEAVIVLTPSLKGVDKATLRRIGAHAVRRLSRRLVRLDGFEGKTGWRRRPDYIWIRCLARDSTLRRLNGPQLERRNNLFLLEWIRSPRKPPIVVRHPAEVAGRSRIVWYDKAHWERVGKAIEHPFLSE